MPAAPAPLSLQDPAAFSAGMSLDGAIDKIFNFRCLHPRGDPAGWP